MAPTIDFGAVNYGCTKYKRRMVLYESVLQPGKRFVSPSKFSIIEKKISRNFAIPLPIKINVEQKQLITNALVVCMLNVIMMEGEFQKLL